MGATAGGEVAGARCQVWGVLNVTPDSFSDGGRFLESDVAVTHALAMVAQGADCIDVGGASSRPRGAVYGEGAPEVTAAEELRRVLPVIEGLRARSEVAISVDTCRGEVASAALEAGADIVNDVSGGSDPALLAAAATHGAQLVLMHRRGDGAVAEPHTRYRDVVGDVVDELRGALAAAQAAGVPSERIWLDPGLGFSKTADQSLALLARLPELVALGQRVLVGASRKAFIAAAAVRPGGSRPEPHEREPGTSVTSAFAVLGGASAVRVHDVAAGYQAVRVAEALERAGGTR